MIYLQMAFFAALFLVMKEDKYRHYIINHIPNSAAVLLFDESDL